MADTRTPPEPVPLFDVRLTEGDLGAVAEVLRSGRLAMGPRTEAFETAFAAQLGCAHAVAVASCTAALHLAYLAAGVGPGNEVIVPAMTFAATATAVLYCGGRPVFADIVGPEDPSLDPEQVERLITPRTKAVGVVPFAGYPARVAELRALCDERGLALVEDAAHAPSAVAADPRDGNAPRKLGTWGQAGCFSFFSNKILSAGEGGLLATDSDVVAAFARSRRSPGARFDEPRAALLLSRLPRLEEDIERRRERTRRYRVAFDALDGVSVPFGDADVAPSSCYAMPILIDDAAVRDELRVALRERHGVQTSLLYPAVHELSAYRERYPGVSLPQTEAMARSEVTVPLYPHLGDAEQDRVIAAIAEELAR